MTDHLDLGDLHVASVVDMGGTAVLTIKGTDGTVRVDVPKDRVEPITATIGELDVVYGGDGTVPVEREVLEELVETAEGDLERLVTVDGYSEGDRVVDELVEAVEAAKDALETETLIGDGGRVVEDRDLCSECEKRPAAVAGLCGVCHRKSVTGTATDGGVVQPSIGVDELGLPEEAASIIPDQIVSLEARDVLEENSSGRPTVERVLEVAVSRRAPEDLKTGDLLSALEHSSGRLALVSYGNTGVTVISWIGGDYDPYEIWTYSVLEDKLGRDPVGRREASRRETKELVEFASPSVVDRSETPLEEGST